MNPETDSKIEQLETDLLLDAIYRRWGYDFRSYSRASIDRRLREYLARSGEPTISGLIGRVVHDQAFFSELALYFSIAVTEMFRDPQFYRSLRNSVFPLLRTWPHFKIWHAGCATGEEVYSLAILLTEANLYDRATLYGTDFNEEALNSARKGVFPASRIKEATQNYQAAGGTQEFSRYYRARYDAVIMDSALKRRMVFHSHNLTADGVFGAMQLVLCRNVLIYFNRDLQNRVLKLLAESLVHGGFLCLGHRESLEFTAVEDQFGLVDEQMRIYKKIAR